MNRRILIDTDPNLDTTRYGFMASSWPAAWVGPQTHDPRQSYVFLFRRVFDLPKPTQIRIHISADQRYELHIDGQYASRGAERSDLKSWAYESYDLSLKAGRHTVAVRLFWLSPDAPAPEAQLTHAPALLLYAEGQANELLSTGVAPWQYQPLPAYRFEDHDRMNSYFATGAQLHIDGRQIRPEIERGEGDERDGWLEARRIAGVALAAQCWESTPYWILRPATLPPMYEEQIQIGIARHVEDISAATDTTSTIAIDPKASLASEQALWNKLLSKAQPLTIAPHTTRRIIIDLDNYYCAYPQFTCSGGGAVVRLRTAESLYHTIANQQNYAVGEKGNRDEINSKCFHGVGIQFTAGPKAVTYTPHQFMAGRYVELFIRTADQPLDISSFTFLDTHYPFRFTADFASSDPAHKQVIPTAQRTLEMCSHDTSMDCPYYERLNYVGDTRLQSLVAYLWSNDDRLARKCMHLFDLSRQASTGFTYSRYPTRTVQTIPTFSLWWTCMIHDFAAWRNDLSFVRERMTGVRGVLEAWRACLDEDTGLLRSPAGWNFVDWVPTWPSGIPAGGADRGFSSIINLQAIYALRLIANLEDHLGELLLARRHRAFAADLQNTVRKRFYDHATGLFADDLAHTRFSEHAQCLAILSGRIPPTFARRLIHKMLHTPAIAQSTIYFSHYLFEALGNVGRVDVLLERLEQWKQLRTHGFRTTFESPEPSRSDCHAWGAHPLYHFLATIAGIRPASFGFTSAIIRPQLGALTHIEGALPLPRHNSQITFALKSTKGHLTGQITLPDNFPATLHANRKTRKLNPGKNVVS